MTQAKGRSREPIEMFNLRTPLDAINLELTRHYVAVAMLTMLKADLIEVHADYAPLTRGIQICNDEPRRSRWHRWLRR
jgi:hypothetical protein